MSELFNLVSILGIGKEVEGEGYEGQDDEDNDDQPKPELDRLWEVSLCIHDVTSRLTCCEWNIDETTCNINIFTAGHTTALSQAGAHLIYWNDPLSLGRVSVETSEMRTLHLTVCGGFDWFLCLLINCSQLKVGMNADEQGSHLDRRTEFAIPPAFHWNKSHHFLPQPQRYICNIFRNICSVWSYK